MVLVDAALLGAVLVAVGAVRGLRVWSARGRGVAPVALALSGRARGLVGADAGRASEAEEDDEDDHKGRPEDGAHVYLSKYSQSPTPHMMYGSPLRGVTVDRSLAPWSGQTQPEAGASVVPSSSAAVNTAA